MSWLEFLLGLRLTGPPLRGCTNSRILTRYHSGASVDLHARLSDPSLYNRQIAKLHAKYALTSELYTQEQSGVTLATMVIRSKELSRTVARTVEQGRYRFSPARIDTIEVDGKSREVFRYELIDRIVHGAISDLIEEATRPLLSPRLFSYRPGVSWLKPSFEFARWVRAANRAHSDPRKRGLFVLRRDIHSYTDTIPVDGISGVWTTVRNALTNGDGELRASDWSLVENVIRPEVASDEDALYTLIRGVPTGQVISCVLFNVYLAELDHAMAAIPGSFYARYSDDILFAHPDPEVAAEAAQLLDAHVLAARLALNPDKSRDLYLNVPGRSAGEAWPGTSNVGFVGAKISARGTISLGRQKQRRLLREVRTRAIRTARGLAGRDRNAVGRTVCSVINRILEGGGGPLEQRSAALVRRAVTDRDELAQLDYWLARIVAHAVTGDPSVRSFRQVSYATIRNDWKLTSLLHSRNRSS